MESSRVISVSRIIPAPADRIFDLLADPAQHPRLDGSGTVARLRKGPPRLSRGARFSMDMRMGIGYVTSNKVIEFVENRSIAWRHAARFVWRYELTPVDGGVQVTESFDYARPWGFLLDRTKFPERNRAAMTATLERIERIVTS